MNSDSSLLIQLFKWYKLEREPNCVQIYPPYLPSSRLNMLESLLYHKETAINNMVHIILRTQQLIIPNKIDNGITSVALKLLTFKHPHK